MFPQIFGKYVLEREIAAGGMARVFLATLRGAGGFEKRLVVKQIRAELASDEGFLQRFVDEAKTAVELSHPNIVPVYELGVEQGVYYIAMELCEGITLAELIRAAGPLAPEEGAYVGVEICRALDYAHRKAGVVHRDVTPRNVMLDAEGAVRIIDFGIAAPSETQPSSKKTAVFGSPGHMPPEQLAGGRLSPATDVFAVGVLLMEAWTGKPPFRRKTAEDSRDALGRPPPLLSSHDERLEPISQLLASAVAVEPLQRPQTAEALARPLRDFMRDADAGDVARRLGSRVAVALESRDAQPATNSESISVRSESGEVTQTFAAREDLVEWTRKLPSAPPDAPASGEHLEEADAALSSDSGPVESSPTASEPSTARLRWIVLAALAMTLLVVLFNSPRPNPDPPSAPAVSAARVREPEPPIVSAERARAAVSARTNVMVPALVGSADSPANPRSTSAAEPREPSPSTSGPGAASARQVAASAEGRLSLTADPPSRVSIGGKERGTTPIVALPLKPGSYPVVFVNAALGERVTTQVQITADQRVSVHADFTSASPRVIVR